MKKTIALTPDTYEALYKLKKQLGMTSFNELILFLVNSYSEQKRSVEGKAEKIKLALDIINSLNELTERRVANLVAVEEILREVVKGG